MQDVKKMKKMLQKMQDEKRYEHTIGVAYIAVALAMRYDEDIKNAEIAGLLHDCAKCMSNKERLKICVKHNIHFSEIEERNPFLLHAKVGSFLAMDIFDVRDKDIINAILNHTTGRPGMSLLEKIIFIADYIEPGRKQAPNLQEIRKLAFIDIDKALIRILEDMLQYLECSGQEIDPMTQKTYDYYRAKEEIA